MKQREMKLGWKNLYSCERAAHRETKRALTKEIKFQNAQINRQCRTIRAYQKKGAKK